jgi:hypothetical protein
LRLQDCDLIDIQVKGEIFREPDADSPDLLIEPSHRDPIQVRQICIQQHPLPAQHQDSLGNPG